MQLKNKYKNFILYIFPNSDSAKASVLENLPHLQIYKSCTVGHIYQSDYSNADWINRISMAAKSNTLIPCAGTCQLHGVRVNWEANLFYFPSKTFLNKILISTILYLRATVLWCFWLPMFLVLGDFKHHLRSCTHTPTHRATRAYVSKITQRLRGGRRTTAAASSHKMSVGRHRWHLPRHNLPLIIYTVRLTVLTPRPEKIQPTNLICTQQPWPAAGGERRSY